jgi:hypothetical protein
LKLAKIAPLKKTKNNFFIKNKLNYPYSYRFSRIAPFIWFLASIFIINFLYKN